jgi:2-C-methyl-D-erythritol 2,4-cyclodiphosphate synthase
MTLDHPEGLAGHSDGDVLLHAITDALLGAVAAGDIGSFFPPGDPRWKDADSAIFLNLALEELQHAGYRIVNVDTTLVLAAPKDFAHRRRNALPRRRPAGCESTR